MLPPEIGQLQALTRLSLDNCEKLVALPPEIGQLQALTKLYAVGCSQLKALPPEIGQLLALTAFGLGGFRPRRRVAAYALLLIVEPRKDNPNQLHAFLLEKPLAVLPFFKSILTDAAYSDWLGKAVKATPSLARLTDADGRRAIDVAHSECRQAMNAALVAAEKAMEVEPKPSATAAVALALALAATAVALATATEPEPEPDLSVTSAPSTKDFDLFISHFTKDNSHTVQSGPLCIEASVHQRAQRGMPCIPPHTTMQVFQAVHSFMSAQGHLQPDHAPEPRGANQQGGDGERSAPLKAGAGSAQRGLLRVQVVTLTLTPTLSL
eukprot:scaffold66583_cov64-Phaeocystis_antarctica.AAC.9